MKTRQLLEKFYEGRSTGEEERALRDYFLGAAETDADLQTDKALFLALAGEEIRLPEGLSGRLERSIERWTARRRWRYMTGSAAAVVGLCIGLFFATREPAGRQRADTFDDPREAALVATQALAFLSSEWNRGLSHVAQADTEIREVNRIVNEYFKE